MIQPKVRTENMGWIVSDTKVQNYGTPCHQIWNLLPLQASSRIHCWNGMAKNVPVASVFYVNLINFDALYYVRMFIDTLWMDTDQ